MMAYQNEETESFPKLLRNALQFLDSYDEDRATQKNHVGFNQKDGGPARELLAKEIWDNDDIKDRIEKRGLC